MIQFINESGTKTCGKKRKSPVFEEPCSKRIYVELKVKAKRKEREYEELVPEPKRKKINEF